MHNLISFLKHQMGGAVMVADHNSNAHTDIHTTGIQNSANNTYSLIHCSGTGARVYCFPVYDSRHKPEPSARRCIHLILQWKPLA